MVYNERFPVLSTISKVLFIGGVLVLIVGLISGLLFFAEFFKLVGSNVANWSFEAKDFIKMTLFIVCTLGGLITMATAESIGVLFAIELNTRTKQ